MKDAGLAGVVLLLFAKLSLVAFGGANAVLPEMRRQVVDVAGWMSDQRFAELFALAQAAPGPNVLVTSLIGWQVAGFAGLAAATVGICLPSCIIAFAVGRLIMHFDGRRWLALIQDALVPIAIGFILASGLVMARATDHDAMAVAITAGAAAFVVLTNRNPLWALAAGTLLAILQHQV